MASRDTLLLFALLLAVTARYAHCLNVTIEKIQVTGGPLSCSMNGSSVLGVNVPPLVGVNVTLACALSGAPVIVNVTTDIHGNFGATLPANITLDLNPGVNATLDIGLDVSCLAIVHLPVKTCSVLPTTGALVGAAELVGLNLIDELRAILRLGIKLFFRLSIA